MRKLIFVTLILLVLIGSAGAKELGPFTYTAAAGFFKDTLVISDLYSFWSGSNDLRGKWVYCAYSANPTTMFECARILKYTATSGSCVVDTASSAAIGFSADLTTGDILWVMDVVPTGARIRSSVVMNWSEPVVVAVDLSSATWNVTANSHEVFNVSGDVEFEITAYCSTSVTTTSSDSIWFYNGEAGATGFRAFSFKGEDATAGESLIPPTWGATAVTANIGWIWSAGAMTLTSGGVWRGECHMGKDIGYLISDHAATAGILIFKCRWRPLTGGSAVVAGAGGTL